MLYIAIISIFYYLINIRLCGDSLIWLMEQSELPINK